MKTIRILVAIITVSFMTGCGDDFLDLTPPDAISDQEAFETLEDFETGLNGIYFTLRSNAGYSMHAEYYGKNMMVAFDTSVDDLFAIEGFTNQYGTQYGWTTSAGTGDVAGLWLVAYRVITRSSNLINFWPNLEEGSEAERNQILGEAKLLRAMAHFDLVRVFAKPYRLANPTDPGIPIVTQENLQEKARDPIGEVYEFIIEEIKEALTLMTQNREVFYVGTNAANALLARVYHEMGDWTNAITYANAVIAAVPLSTGNDYLNIWRQDDGNEVIFRTAIHPTEFSNAANVGSNYVGGNPPQEGVWRLDYVPSIELLSMYHPDDIRLEAFFLQNTATPAGTMTVAIKYNPENPNYANRGMNTVKIFRASEAYLIRAEAYSYSDEALANADLEALRAARITGYTHTDLSGDALKEAIYDERRMEFFGEGQRWFDLRRRGVGFARTPQPGTAPGRDLVIEATNYRWLWPIPQAELNANTLITQNPGYASE